MWWFQEGLCALPAALVVWTSASFIFPFIIAVLLKHVDPLVPYISDTGTVTPEKCLFGIMLNLSSLLGVATMYVRYKHVEALNTEESNVIRWNKAGLGLGLISCFGLLVVANFQKTDMIHMHILGAVLTFGIGGLYILLQTIMSYKMQTPVHGKRIFWIRLLVVIWCFVSMLLMFVTSLILHFIFKGSTMAKKLHWDPHENGYTSHVISTVSEWSLAFSFVSFFLTYIRDFKNIKLRVLAILNHDHLEGPLHNAANEERTPLLAGAL
ncbi:DNA damage-regulated autophagy modulator protein 2 [Protopterus annectens]|uniref:DNA damage-regulated autophagy modulator protein 2 n=1 Tax=Protopterus annectens TaxID=7888 RepID=UPI001CF9BFA4|nr:DNA damage-regulated autophagy modulator protein 2 [Protopterus annectens]XP_043932589.1 DNA damage-regulated autophagy modulator protein 2 [Protopterus annectens]